MNPQEIYNGHTLQCTSTDQARPLVNGNYVIGRLGGYVLCLIPGRPEQPPRYVTHQISQDGSTFWGNYFDDIEEAWDNLVSRYIGEDIQRLLDDRELLEPPW